MGDFEIVVTTFMGLEKTLANEIEKIGGKEIEILKRAVRFIGDDETLYTSNLHLRTALRVLVPIYDFTAYDDTDLYEEIKRFQWEKIMNLDQTFAIDATIGGTVFNHSKYVALKVKDAIVDRFRDKTGERPNVAKENPQILINVHVNQDHVTVSLDSSGLSLDKRGYRKFSTEAPINEALAAGIILISQWQPSTPFYDPMAGSGTFSIEAAMIGNNIPVGFNRTFCFENWLDFDSELYEKVRKKLKTNVKNNKISIFARDIENSNIENLLKNAKEAGVEQMLDYKVEDFFESEALTLNGLLIINPPYNERLKLDNPEEFYALIGDTFKKKYKGFDAWIISSDKESLKRVGLRAEQKTDLMNGGLEARLQKYVLFEGKRF